MSSAVFHSEFQLYCRFRSVLTSLYEFGVATHLVHVAITSDQYCGSILHVDICQRPLVVSRTSDKAALVAVVVECIRWLSHTND